MAGIERIAADTRQVFRRSIIFPHTASGSGVIQRENGGAVDRGQDEGIGFGYDPAEVLDPKLRVRIRVNP